MRYLIFFLIAFGVLAEDAESHKLVTFDELCTFEFKFGKAIATTEEERQQRFKEAIEQIPDAVKALDKKSVRIDGYMYPIKLRKGRAEAFLLMRGLQSCCFGRFPRLNEIIYVKMDEPAHFEQFSPVTVYGSFIVGGELDADDAGPAVYRLSGTKVTKSFNKLLPAHDQPGHQGAP
jgi:hypothetical protein